VFVLDANGKASAEANLQVKLAFGADATEELALRWDAGCLCYRGSLAASVDATLQPLTVSLVAGGQAFVGAAASLRAVADARLRAEGKVTADAALDASAAARARLNANLAAKLPEVKAKVGAAEAKVASGVKVNVQAPKVNVQAPKVNVNQSATAGTQAGGKAKASAGFSIGTK
jgi:hypothetical protein